MIQISELQFYISNHGLARESVAAHILFCYEAFWWKLLSTVLSFTGAIKCHIEALSPFHFPYTVTSLTFTVTPVIASSWESHFHKGLNNLILMCLDRHQEGCLCFSQKAVDDAKDLILKNSYSALPQIIPVQPQFSTWECTKTRLTETVHCQPCRDTAAV